MPDKLQAWAEMAGITREEFSSLIDVSMGIASKIDTRIQNVLSDRTEHAMSVGEIRMITAALALAWATEDATSDWGWHVNENFSALDLAGDVLMAATSYIHERRVSL